MAKSKIKSISFKDAYNEQYMYLMSQDNPSQFVCELIKEHMEQGIDFTSRVERIVSEYISNNIQLISQSTTQTQPIESNEDIVDPWG